LKKSKSFQLSRTHKFVQHNEELNYHSGDQTTALTPNKKLIPQWINCVANYYLKYAIYSPSFRLLFVSFFILCSSSASKKEGNSRKERKKLINSIYEFPFIKCNSRSASCSRLETNFLRCSRRSTAFNLVSLGAVQLFTIFTHTIGCSPLADSIA
jgi:hypothetical protein